MTSSLVSSWIARGAVTLALAALAALAHSAPAHAQGLGRQLDSPSGPSARPAPVSASGGGGADSAIPAVPQPNGAGYVPQPPGSGDASVDLRIRALDVSLRSLAASSGPDPLRSILSMLAGGASIAIGAILLEVGPPGDALAPYLMVLGGTQVVRSLLVDFILPPNAGPASLQYSQMPSGTAGERAARIEYGEAQLGAIAEAAMIARVVDGSLNIAGALAVIPAYLVPRDFMFLSDFEAIIFIAPAISLITGIITLASPSGAEQRWDAYRRLRDRVAADDEAGAELSLPPPGPTFAFGAATDPRGGGMLSLSGSF